MKVSRKVPASTPVLCPACRHMFPNPGRSIRSPHRSSRSGRGGGLPLKYVGMAALVIGMLGIVGAGGYYLIGMFTGSGGGGGGGGGLFSSGPSPIVIHDAKGDDPLAFVPADANVVIGMKAKDAGNSAFKAIYDYSLSQFGLNKTDGDWKKDTGLEYAELFDTTIIALKMGDYAAAPQGATLIVKSTKEFDPTTFGKWIGNVDSKKSEGKEYAASPKNLSKLKTVFFPAKHIMVMSDQPADQLAGVFKSDGSAPGMSKEGIDLIRKTDKSPVWLVAPFDAKVKDEIKAGKGPATMLAGLLPADFDPRLKKVLPDAKGMTASVSAEGNKAVLSASLVCGSDTIAAEFTEFLQFAWGKNMSIISKGLPLAKDANPSMVALLKGAVISWKEGGLKIFREDTASVLTVKTEAPLGGVVSEGIAGLQRSTQQVIVASSAPPPSPTPEPKPDPKPEPKPDPKPEPKPDPKPEPKPEPKPDMLKLSAEEEIMLKLVNDARSKDPKKPPELKPNAMLFKVARDHAAKMAKEGKLDEELDEKKLTTLLTTAGYKLKAGKATANQTADKDLQPAAAFNAWAETPAAKELFLEANEDTGIGIAKSDKGEIFYLMIYASPEK